ncbi:MAG TPA: hypothetical protein VMX38_13490 [Verrucomicrobiae bacterium]|nr:hypothetical protein [Verrucomicrobiae bacterium]
MHFLVILVALLLAACIGIVLLFVAYQLALKSKPGRYSNAVGNALFQAHTFIHPGAQNIVEAKKEHEEDAGEGDDTPPELPPWAESGK